MAAPAAAATVQRLRDRHHSAARMPGRSRITSSRRTAPVPTSRPTATAAPASAEYVNRRPGSDPSDRIRTVGSDPRARTASANAAAPKATAGACSHPLTAKNHSGLPRPSATRTGTPKPGGASLTAAPSVTTAPAIDSSTSPRMPATATATAWNIAENGENIACVVPAVAMMNGGRIGRNSSAGSRNAPGYGISRLVSLCCARARACTYFTPMSPEYTASGARTQRPKMV